MVVCPSQKEKSRPVVSSTGTPSSSLSLYMYNFMCNECKLKDLTCEYFSCCCCPAPLKWEPRKRSKQGIQTSGLLRPVRSLVKCHDRVWGLGGLNATEPVWWGPHLKARAQRERALRNSTHNKDCREARQQSNAIHKRSVMFSRVFFPPTPPPKRKCEKKLTCFGVRSLYWETDVVVFLLAEVTNTRW